MKVEALINLFDENNDVIVKKKRLSFVTIFFLWKKVKDFSIQSKYFSFSVIKILTNENKFEFNY